MKIILIHWDEYSNYSKEAYPYTKKTLEIIISNFDEITTIELIDYHDEKNQELPFPKKEIKTDIWTEVKNEDLS